MVCLPCIVIPAFLFIWHKFLQPIFLRFWNPWGKVEDKPAEGEDNKNSPEDSKLDSAATTNGVTTRSKATAVGGGGDGHSKDD